MSEMSVSPNFDAVMEVTKNEALTGTAERLREVLAGYFAGRGMNREECYALVLEVNGQSAQRELELETVGQAIGRAVGVLTALARAQNIDVSFGAALETQKILTATGQWLRELDELWHEATLANLAGWKSPDELEREG